MWHGVSTRVSAELNQLREEHCTLRKQAAWLHNECLVARAAESLLSEKLFTQSVAVDNIRRALGQRTTCPRKYPKAVPVTERWPHEPLSKQHQKLRCNAQPRVRQPAGCIASLLPWAKRVQQGSVAAGNHSGSRGQCRPGRHSDD
eukprot:COSAG01_NODE_12622_length_1709_cov_6.138509_1_plen_145_part_00